MIDFLVSPWNTKLFSRCRKFLFDADIVTGQLLEFPYYFQGTTGPPGPRGREVSAVIRVLYWHQMLLSSGHCQHYNY